MTADDAGPQTRDGLVDARDAAWSAWKAAEHRHAGDGPLRFTEYVEATHALRKFDMPHLAAMTGTERPDEAEDSEYPRTTRRDRPME